jgi:hypothetical protein
MVAVVALLLVDRLGSVSHQYWTLRRLTQIYNKTSLASLCAGPVSAFRERTGRWPDSIAEAQRDLKDALRRQARFVPTGGDFYPSIWPPNREGWPFSILLGPPEGLADPRTRGVPFLYFRPADADPSSRPPSSAEPRPNLDSVVLADPQPTNGKRNVVLLRQLLPAARPRTGSEIVTSVTESEFRRLVTVK